MTEKDVIDNDAAALIVRAATQDEIAVLQDLAATPSLRVLATAPDLLHVFARRGFRQAAAVLLTAGADPNMALDGLTPLHAAILAGQVEMTAFLLRHGADASLRVTAGRDADCNAFHLAITSASPAALKVLLESGAPEALYETVMRDGRVVDVLRLVLRTERPEMLAMLVAGGVSLNRADTNGLTPAQFLILHRASKHEAVDMLRILHENGADMEGSVTAGGDTLLMLAAREGWAQGFDYLLAAGMPTGGRNRDGDTLLHAAARGQHIGVLRQVLKMGFDINVRNRAGQTALHLAAHRNRLQHVETLVSYGADPYVADRQGRTPDMVCQARVQAMTRQAVLRAQRAVGPRRGVRPRAKVAFRSSKRR